MQTSFPVRTHWESGGKFPDGSGVPCAPGAQPLGAPDRVRVGLRVPIAISKAQGALYLASGVTRNLSSPATEPGEATVPRAVTLDVRKTPSEIKLSGNIVRLMQRRILFFALLMHEPKRSMHQ